ncbi:class I SAM-dependent methyltransferase [Bacillus sp. BP-3]|uniref:class I SAM-dependent methyltransferase n=1 Tax=Bacillus sp. BP-3 TaxID=3022773 RepID=UPI00232D4A02|nr:class I SAM-dependent methyltransferase [Bacillus sp. BP-3]MDC2865090.1 class I SAM-dependent methyltransferase [Bacillus sp. BP-3]
MKLERILPFARTLLERAVKEGDYAVDATLGNGHDTCFLAELVGENGKVFGFDIQEEAITNSSARLQEKGLNERAVLIHDSHDTLTAVLPEDTKGKVTGAIFNLGYLPGGDKSIVTKPNSTLSALQQLLEFMAPEGIIVLVIYHGHPEGQTERDAVVRFAEQLEQKEAHVLKYEFMNQQNNPPFIVAIEKR